MLDGNSAAELDNDKFMSEVDQKLEELNRANNWKIIKMELLCGSKINGLFTLNEHIINKYPEVFNHDFDFMESYKRGELHPDIRKFVECEACTLASIICG